MSEDFPQPNQPYQPPQAAGNRAWLVPVTEGEQVAAMNAQQLPTASGQGEFNLPMHPAASYDQYPVDDSTEETHQPEAPATLLWPSSYTHEGVYDHTESADTHPEPSLHNNTADSTLRQDVDAYDAQTGFRHEVPVHPPTVGAQHGHGGGHDSYDFGPNAV